MFDDKTTGKDFIKQSLLNYSDCPKTQTLQKKSLKTMMKKMMMTSIK